jgi:hypothetical protein
MEYLLTNKEKFQNSSQYDHSSDDTSLGGFFEAFNFSFAEKFVADNAKEWTESGKSLNEQVMLNIISYYSGRRLIGSLWARP